MIEARFNPFPGLRPFELHEKHLFFGREAQTAEMLQRLGSTRFLAAVGPSGSGKSSLVRAGLVPELLGGANPRAGSHWVVVIFRPGGDPMGALAAALAESELYAGQLEDGAAHVEATLNRSARGLIEAVRQAHPPPVTRVLVVVDQFEELFRYANALPGRQDAADAFVRRLLEAANDPQERLYVVLTMRSDFIGDCARFPGLAEAINRAQYLIPRLTRDQWRSAIEGPIRVGGGTITPRLLQRLLADVADDPDQLPVLQHALMRTWNHWAQESSGIPSSKAPLDLPHYEAIGAMAEALSRHAEEALNELPEGPARRIAERLFRALTEKGPDGRGIRRPARFDILQSACGATDTELRQVAAVFRQAGRTFVLPGGGSELTPATVLDISHESLMRVWTRLRDWVDTEAQSARTFHRLSETAQLWSEGRAGLYRDPELALALRWRETNLPTDGWGRLQQGNFALALRFLDESAAAARNEQEAREAARRQELDQARAHAAEEARRARIFAAVAVGMTAMVILMVVAAFWLRRLQREAVSRELAAHAVHQLKVDPELSVLLATEAMRIAPLAATEDVLRQALFASPVRGTLRPDPVPPEEQAIRISTFSPDGARILTAGVNSNAVLWDSSGRTVAILRGHTAGITSAEFGGAGLLVTSSDDGTARLWNAYDGHPVAVLPSGRDRVSTATFSPDGLRVATASEEGAIRIWPSPSWTNALLLTPLRGRLNGVAFTSDGNHLIAYAEAGRSRLWTLSATPTDALLPGAPPKLIQGVTSADGRQIFALGAASNPFLGAWRLDENALAPEWTANSAPRGISLAASHRTPRLVVAQQKPHVATVWNATNGTLLATLTGHRAGLKDARFSPDDQLVATASDDKTARLWNLAGDTLEELPGHSRAVNQARFNPDGTRVITASDDGTARIWAVLTGREFRISSPPLAEVAFSTDGRWFGALREDADGTQTYGWGATSEPEKVREIASGLSGVAFSGDGTTSVLVESRVLRIVRPPGVPSAPVLMRDLRGAIVALDHTGTRMFLASTGVRAELWQLKPSFRAVPVRGQEWTSELSAVETAAFSRDGRWIATVAGRTNLLIWNFTGTPGPDGMVTPQLWRRMTNANGYKSGLTDSLVFTPDSRALVCLIDGTSAVQQWSLENAGAADPVWETREIAGGAVNRAAFSTDGRFLVAASSDGTAGILDAQTGYLIATLRGQAGPMLRATFLQGTDAVLTAGSNGTMRRFDTEACGNVQQVMDLAARRVTRGFTEAERRRYLGD